MTGPSALRVGVVYPELLGTYGDAGNGVVLAQRAAWRGRRVELVHVGVDDPLPTLDIYCLGGGEDGPQVGAAEGLRAGRAIQRAVAHGAVVLAVCAGFQLVGVTFPDADGRRIEGAAILDVETTRGAGRRMVGEVVSEPLTGSLPPMSGFENHAGITRVGPGARPLGRVIAGTGNGGGDGTEGAWSGRVVGTYLHGPVLARNPALADLLLSWALGEVVIEPLDDSAEASLRAERFAASRASMTSTGWSAAGRWCRRVRT